MCGISGFNWSDETKIKKMMHVQSHRGPDAEGVFLNEQVTLGHNRLSVIDLSSSANQPMTTMVGDLAIVFNGEIYNFRELKEELKDEYDFKTKSDTEVILAGYKKWGRDVVSKLNGMFAFALWDKQQGELFCARDHAGIKPFYYYFDGEKFIFASEVRAILEHDVPRKLNKTAFGHYMRMLYVPEPMTLIENVSKLPPRSTLVLKGNKLTVSSYELNRKEIFTGTYSEAVSATRSNVLSAIERQLVSDVPVGVYLSGGIDSSTVLFGMKEFVQKIETFSIGFDLGEGEESTKFNADLELAKKTAKYFGAKHNTVMVSSSDVLRDFENCNTDDLISHPTAVPMSLLAKLAKEKVTVALSGSGGDELFGGYERYRLAYAANMYKKFPSLLRALGKLHSRVAKMDYDNCASLYQEFMFQNESTIRSVIKKEFLSDVVESEKHFATYVDESLHPSVALMQADQKSWLPEYFFMLSDKMSMKSSLEERVPLIDKELVEFSNSLPVQYKVDLWNTKKVLKDAFRADLPEYLFNQPKRGWFSPGAKWLRHPEFVPYAREVLDSSYYTNTKAMFNWDTVSRTLERHINKEEYNLTPIWALLSFQVWAKKHKIEV